MGFDPSVKSLPLKKEKFAYIQSICGEVGNKEKIIVVFFINILLLSESSLII